MKPILDSAAALFFYSGSCSHSDLVVCLADEMEVEVADKVGGPILYVYDHKSRFVIQVLEPERVAEDDADHYKHAGFGRLPQAFATALVERSLWTSCVTFDKFRMADFVKIVQSLGNSTMLNWIDIGNEIYSPNEFVATFTDYRPSRLKTIFRNLFRRD